MPSIDIGSPSGSIAIVSCVLAEVLSPVWSSSSGMNRGNALLLALPLSPATVFSSFWPSVSWVALRTKLDLAESNLSASATCRPQRDS